MIAGKRPEAPGAAHSHGEVRTPERPDPARMPKILFINQYYWPDKASTAQHLADLAESLATRGYECHVLCSRGAYRPGQPPLPRSETHEGVHIHRVGATSLGRRSTLRRMTDYLSFFAGAAVRGLALPRFDAVVTLTTPPLIGLLGTLARRIRGSRHVYWSMDLHPDASLALGRMSARNPAVALLDRLSTAIYRRADLVVALGPYMADRVAAKGVRADRLAILPVWSDGREIAPLPREGHPLRAAMGLSDKFVAMYSGNLGLAHGFDEFLEAARRLRHRDDVVFLFVGDGPRLAEVRAAKKSERLENIQLRDYFPREALKASLTVADVHLISMRPEMTGIVVPGKLYGAMASGRPILFVGPAHCETADAIRDAECGLTVATGDTDSLVRSIEDLAADTDLRRALGERGRSAFLDEYDRAPCCDRWAGVLDALTGRLAIRPVEAEHVHFTAIPAEAPAETPGRGA